MPDIKAPDTTATTYPFKKKTYFTPFFKLAITFFLSLLLLLTLFPLGYPFYGYGTVAFSLLTGLFFMSSIISLFYYIAQFYKKIKDQDTPQKTKWVVIGTGASFFLIGVGLGIAIIITANSALTLGSVINGALFCAFLGGSFLALFSRLYPQGKTSTEVIAVWGTFGLCVFALIYVMGFTNYLAFLPSLGSLVGFTFLGINVFVMVLFAIVGLASYFAKSWDYLNNWKTHAKNNSIKENRPWEHRLAFAGLLIGAAIFVTLIVLMNTIQLNPFRDGPLATISAAIIAWSACASILSKLGRSIDETTQARERAPNTPIKQTHPGYEHTILPSVPNSYEKKFTAFFNQHKHDAWVYVARPLLTSGLFLMLGFALYALSPLAVAGQFLMVDWALAKPTFAISLAAISVALIANLMMRWVNPAVSNIPSHQALIAAVEAKKILGILRSHPTHTHYIASKNLPPQDLDTLKSALLAQLVSINRLLEPKWRGALVGYDERQLDADYRLLNDLLSKETSQQLTELDRLESTQKIAQILTRLEGAQINTNYRPTSEEGSAIPWVATSITLFVSCLTLVLLLLTGVLNLADAAWAMPLAAASGFFSWVAIHHFLDKISGGPYATLAVIFAVISTILAALSVVAWSGASIATISLVGMQVVFPVLFFVSLLGISALLYFAQKNKHPASPNPQSIKAAEWTVKGIKIALLAGFLLLAYLSIATLFNLGGTGIFSNLTDFVLNLLTPLAINPAEILQWISTFSITIFSVSSTIAFELLKSVLTQSPTKMHEVAGNQQKREERIEFAGLLVKLAFIGGIIFTLIAMPSAFIAGNTELLGIFLTVALVMPLFSIPRIPTIFDRINPKIREFLNNFVGLKPFTDKNAPAKTFGRELIVASILTMIAVIAGLATKAPLTLTIPVLVIGGVATLIFRWSHIQWRSEHSPSTMVQDSLAALPTPSILETRPTATDDLAKQAAQTGTSLFSPPSTFRRPTDTGIQDSSTQINH